MQRQLLCLGGGAGAPAARRVRLLLRQVLAPRPGRPELRALHGSARQGFHLKKSAMVSGRGFCGEFDFHSSQHSDAVTIGDVSFKLKTPKNPELVPQNN